MSDVSVGVVSLDLVLKDQISGMLNKYVSNIKNALNKPLQEMSDSVGKGFDKAFDSIGKTAEKMSDTVKKPMKTVEKVMNDTAESMKQGFEDSSIYAEGVLEKCLGDMAAESKKRNDAIQADLNKTTEKLSKPIPVTFTAEQLAADAEVDKITKNFKEGIDKAVDETVSKVKESIGNFEVSADPVKRLEQELQNTEEKIGLVNARWQELQSSLANAQTDEEAAKICSELNKVEGQMIRLKGSAEKLNDKIASMPKSANPSSLKDRFKSVFSSIFDNAKSITKKAASAVKNVFGGAFNKVKSIGGKAMDHVKSKISGMKQAANGVSKPFNQLGKSLRRAAKSVFLMAGAYAVFRGLKSAISDVCNNNEEFKKSLNEVKANLQVAFTPIINAIMPAINTLMSGLAALTKGFATFVNELFGTTYKKSLEACKKVQKVGKEAKKNSQTYLAAFDEMNVAQDTAKDSDSDSGIDYDAVSSEGNKVAEKFAKKFKAVVADLFKPIKDAWAKYGQPVMDAFRHAGSSMKSLFIDIAKDFKDIWTNGTGEAVVGSLLKLTASLVDNIGKIADAFRKAWNQGDRGKKLIESFLTTFYKIINVITAISDSFGKAFESPVGVSLIGNVLDIITNISNFVGNLAEQFTIAWTNAGLGDEIMQNLLGVFDSIAGFVERITGSLSVWAGELDFGPLLESLNGLFEGFTTLSDAIGGVLGDVIEDVLLPLGKWTFEKGLPALIDTVSAAFDGLGKVIDAIRPGLKYFYDKVLTPIGEWTGKLITDVLGKLKELFAKVADTFQKKGDKIQNILNGVSDAFAFAWKIIEPILNTAKKVICWAFDVIGDSIGAIIDIFSGVIDFIKGVFTGDWKKAWEGIKDIFKGVWDLLFGIIKAPINLIIKGLNWLWGAIYDAVAGIVNTVGDIVGWVGDIFGCDWGFSIPEDPPLIPYLAKGGLATAPTLAVVGDNRNAKADPEVIAPLSKLEGMLGDNSKVEQLLQEIIVILKTLDLTFEGKIDERTLWKAIVKLVREDRVRTGGALF